MNPRVSVILPVYNAEKFVGSAIQSILDQSFGDFELILINDGSTDNSESLILHFSDPRIRYVRNQKNLGLVDTLNKGLGLALGEYIARMDGDDISLPTRFEKQVAFLDGHPEVTVVATRLVLINEQGYQIDYWKEDASNRSVEEINRQLPIANCIGHPTVMMRAKPVKAIGYKHELKKAEDWGLWLELVSNGSVIAKLDEILVQYRILKTSFTALANQGNVTKKVKAFKWDYLTYKLKLGKFKSFDRRVVSSLFKDWLRFFFKPAVYYLRHLLKLDWLRLGQQFLKTKRQLEALRQPVRLIYIFPYFHTGGAEKVHASILEAVNATDSVTFITRHSEDQAFLPKFQTYSTVIEVDELIMLGYTRRWLIKKIQALFSGSLTLMSCNSQFFYNLIPYLPGEVRCIDLIHAFVHLDEVGPERWSIPVVSRLATRVVINEKTKADFANFYRAHEIDPVYLSRIQCIPNFVENKSFEKRSYEEPLKVLYAGRGSAEKRLPLIAQIAYELKRKNRPIEFHFAGPVEGAIPKTYLDACVLHGNLTQEQEMTALYAQCDIIIIASSREGFPMVIMEAMMQGVMPFSTAVGGIPEHIHSGINGVLIHETQEEAIVQCFVRWFDYYLEHKTELATLSKNAHQYAVQHFSKAFFYNAYLDLLKP